jgi:predicted lipoprotein with Yx(FWY)xxD motif
MRSTVKIFLPTLAVSLTLAACGSSSSSSSSSTAGSGTSSSGATGQAVKAISNSKLGTTVLVNAHGMTLYHLSGEGKGKFICVNALCVKHWPPVSASATTSAVSGLGTVKRPDGTEQLTYNGEPLYTFAGDSAPGQVNGGGTVDGGTWSPVTTSASTTSAGKSSSSGGGSAGGEGGGERAVESSSGSGSGGGGSGGGYGY